MRWASLGLTNGLVDDMAVPREWLAAHDREVAAKALKQAGNELPGWMPGRDRVSEWLWTRAAAIVSEPSTPEQEVEG